MEASSAKRHKTTWRRGLEVFTLQNEVHETHTQDHIHKTSSSPGPFFYNEQTMNSKMRRHRRRYPRHRGPRQTRAPTHATPAPRTYENHSGDRTLETRLMPTP